MHIRPWGERRSTGVAGLAAVALLLVGCSPGDGGAPPVAAATGATQAAAPASQVDITPTGGDVNPTTPIVVKANGGRLTSVTVKNAVKGNTVQGRLSPDGQTWTSGEELGYGSTYHVAAEAVGADGKPAEQKADITTLTPSSQAYPALTPAPPAADTTFGVGQIIGVSFDQPVTDRAATEKAMKVTTNPPQPGAWHWLDSQTAHYRGPSYWKAGTTIQLDADVYGVDLGGGVYGKADRSATYKIHDSWVAKADGNADQMQIVHNGSVIDTMPISLGKDQTPTHAGPHVISDRQQQVEMNSCSYKLCPPDPRAYDVIEYFAERISADGEFVHENRNTVAQQGSSNVSHGCINLSPENAQKFFDEFGLGDVVEVTNSGGSKLKIDDTYGDWELSWAEWTAS